jgi:copper chaperone NosL
MLPRLRNALEGFYAFLEQPIRLWSRLALTTLLVPLSIAFIVPLWVVTITTPQQPDGLWLDVYATRMASGHDGGDLLQINALHQSIGMQTLDARTLGDLDWLPFGLGALALLVLRVAAVGNVRSLVDVAVLVIYFCGFTLARFAHHVHALGHTLSPDAPTKVVPFQPVMFGQQQVGDALVRAGPGSGTYLVAVFACGIVAITGWHLFEGRREAKLRRPPT